MWNYFSLLSSFQTELLTDLPVYIHNTTVTSYNVKIITGVQHEQFSFHGQTVSSGNAHRKKRRVWPTQVSETPLNVKLPYPPAATQAEKNTGTVVPTLKCLARDIKLDFQTFFCHSGYKGVHDYCHWPWTSHPLRSIYLPVASIMPLKPATDFFTMGQRRIKSHWSSNYLRVRIRLIMTGWLKW